MRRTSFLKGNSDQMYLDYYSTLVRTNQPQRALLIQIYVYKEHSAIMLLLVALFKLLKE